MNRSVATKLMNMCMVYDGGKILVIDRTSDKWTGVAFPGGHVENGEAFAESVIREVYEETGLTIENPVLCGIKEWQNDDLSRDVVFLYKTNKFSGELVSSNEGDVFWISREDIINYKLARDFGELLRVFEDDSLSEFYYKRMQNGWEKRIY